MGRSLGDWVAGNKNQNKNVRKKNRNKKKQSEEFFWLFEKFFEKTNKMNRFDSCNDENIQQFIDKSKNQNTTNATR